MTTTLYAWCLHAFMFLMAGRTLLIDQVALSFAIDERASIAPIYRTRLLNDAKMTRALAIAVAWQESGGRVNVMASNGDGGTCAFQITPGWPSLLEDADECTRVGMTMLKRSYEVDHAHPVAMFARGNQWRTEEARHLSDEREALAEYLYVAVK